MHYIPYQKISIELVSGLPLRTKEVVLQRFGLQGGLPLTLQAIGKDHAITRERVRQIVEEGLRQIREEIRSPQKEQRVRPAFSYFIDTLKKAGSLKRQDLLLLLLQVQDAVQEALFLLTLGEQFYEQRETQDFHPFWSLKQELVHQAPSFHEQLLEYFENQRQPFSAKELSKVYGREVVSYLEVSKHIMQGHEGAWGLKTWPEINPRGMRDKAFLVLKTEHKPLHFSAVASLIEKLQEKLGGKKKPVLSQTVHNELIKDPRFVLVGRGTYGLQDWGLESGTVKDVMHSILKMNGSSMSKEELIAQTLGKRQVKESTILLNLQDKRMFLRNSDGTYSLRT